MDSDFDVSGDSGFPIGSGFPDGRRQWYSEQFAAVQELAAEAAAMTTAAGRAAHHRAATGLAAQAERASATFWETAEHRRGSVLAGVFAGLAALYEFARDVEAQLDVGAPGLGADDVERLVPTLLPALRSCMKFAADEIAALALGLVQSDVGVSRSILSEMNAAGRDCDAIAAQVARDRAAAQALHDRDTAYAADRRRADRLMGRTPEGGPDDDPGDDPDDGGGRWTYDDFDGPEEPEEPPPLAAESPRPAPAARQPAARGPHYPVLTPVELADLLGGLDIARDTRGQDGLWNDPGLVSGGHRDGWSDESREEESANEDSDGEGREDSVGKGREGRGGPDGRIARTAKARPTQS